MSMSNCDNRCDCVFLGVAASIIIGIVAGFLAVGEIITFTATFFWVAIAIAAVSLVVLLLTAGATGDDIACRGKCCIVSTLIASILGAALVAGILLVAGFAAGSIAGSIFIGFLVLFVSLIFTTTACLIKCLIGCRF